jgi:GntR family transcriptional regulator
VTYDAVEDPRPRHEQIAADLRAVIMAGDLEDEVPSVAELSKQFEAATGTVQRALAILRTEGLILTRQGARSLVDRDHLKVIETSPYVDASKVSYDLLEVTELAAGVEVARAFSRDPFRPDDVMVVLRKRLMRERADGRPMELSWSYYPLDLAEGTELAARRKIRDGAPRVLAELGHREASQEDTVTTRAPTSEELRLLRLPAHASVLRTLRVIRDPDGRPVEVSILVKSGHRFALKDRQILE